MNSYLVASSLALGMVSLIKRTGPLQLIVRAITYGRAAGFVAGRIAGEIPSEVRRLWSPVVARARREL